MDFREDDEVLLKRARRRYELGRLRRALLGALPVVLLGAAAVTLGSRPWSAGGFGVAALAAAAVFLWFGREPQRAVLPAMVAGAVPLALALCANHWHACGSGGCTSLCVPACTVGGLVAGLAVAGIGLRRRASLWYWVAASGLTVLEGAMGCSCVGGAGVVGLVAGFSVGLVPAVFRRRASAAR